MRKAMIRSRLLRALPMLLVPALLLGCSVENRDDQGSRGSGAGSGTDAGDDEPRDDMTDERIVQWDSVEEVGASSLRVHFTAGTTSCYGTRAAVQEDSDEILVATITGTLPEAHSACPDVGRDASLLVELEDEVGDREIGHLEDESILRR